jgi:DNA-directed RNA polymerase subunit RPC12/RpoP
MDYKCVSCGKKSKEKYCHDCSGKIIQKIKDRKAKKRIRQKINRIISDGFMTLPSRAWFIESMTTIKGLKETRIKNLKHIDNITKQILKITDERI